MAVIQRESKCNFLGIIPIYFHTYTTAFPNIASGWNFPNSTFVPMEQHVYNLNNVTVGLHAKILDLATGITDVSLGNIAATDGNNQALPCCTSVGNVGTFGGWVYGNQAGGKRFYGFNSSFTYGVNVTRSTFQMDFGVSLDPIPSNTNFPTAFIGANIPMSDGGVFGSATVNLVNYTCEYNPRGFVASTILGAQANLGLGSLTQSMRYGIAGQGRVGVNSVTYCSIGSDSDNTQRTLLLTTDFTNDSNTWKQNITWENPPGGYDLDTTMVQRSNVNGLGDTTVRGFLRILRDEITVGGVALHGFGVLTAIDASGYYLIQLIPMDTTAKNWQAGTGIYSAKIDRSGTLFFKSVNSATTIYASAGSVLRQLPIYPPIPLPDHGDTDLTLNMMRAK